MIKPLIPSVYYSTNYMKSVFSLFYLIFHFTFLRSSCLLSDYNLSHLLPTMPALDRNRKVVCDNCGTQVSKQNLAKQKMKSSVGTLYCSQCPNFSAKSRNDFYNHIAKTHGAPKPKIAQTCKECKEELTGFCALRQHKNKVHGHSFETSGISSPLLYGINDDSLKEKIRACQHFLVNSQMEKKRHTVFIFALDVSVLMNSIQSWIMCFNNSIVQLKLTWPLVFFLKKSKTVAVGIVMHTRIILCCRSPNCLALERIWNTLKHCLLEKMSLNLVPVKESRQCGNSLD